MRHLKDVSRRFKNGFRYVMSCLYLICGKSLNFLSSMIAREPQRQREPRRQRLDRFISVVFCLCIPLFTTCKYMFYVMQASYISYSLAKKSVSASLQSTIVCQTKIADYLLTSFATYAMSRISSIVGAWLFGSLEMPDSSALGHPTALNQRTQTRIITIPLASTYAIRVRRFVLIYPPCAVHFPRSTIIQDPSFRIRRPLVQKTAITLTFIIQT